MIENWNFNLKVQMSILLYYSLKTEIFLKYPNFSLITRRKEGNSAHLIKTCLSVFKIHTISLCQFSVPGIGLRGYISIYTYKDL